ncbi:alpha/beta fold hydrolase [Sulfitobacter sp. W074]|uniref:alpha/beta fold hydrolase n=1 Tax=Sulfitobacter sp. W074 TaxID=2867026 RepID=UPI0021A5F421|nr:alpha/beta hydrolase [Sulfitobacter sp. W074]UWR38422.1 alpha/beta hydrolase [Sulfitobacter sp. W074]
MGIDGLAKRPWLLLPGTLCTSEIFSDFLDALAVPQSNRHAVVLDRPSVKDYADLCAKISQETVVCGFSLGAIVAAHLSSQMAAHRVVLFGINPNADDPAKNQGRYDLARDVAALGGAGAMASRAPVFHGANPEHTRARVLAMADETSNLIDAQTQIALTRPSVLPALSDTQYPVYVLTGELDNTTSPDKGRTAADAAPKGRFECLDGLGHFALLEDPEACARALIKCEERENATN